MDPTSYFRAFLKQHFLKTAHGNQGKVALKCGLEPKYLSDYKRGRKNMGEDNRVKIAQALGYKYEDALKIGRAVMEKENDIETLQEEKGEYENHGGWKPGPIKDISGFEKGHEIWKAYRLLADICESGDKILIRAIFANLEAFKEAADRKKTEKELRRRIDDIEKLLHHKGLMVIERRAGRDRRQVSMPNIDPERRSGKDRRKAG